MMAVAMFSAEGSMNAVVDSSDSETESDSEMSSRGGAEPSSSVLIDSGGGGGEDSNDDEELEVFSPGATGSAAHRTSKRNGTETQYDALRFLLFFYNNNLFFCWRGYILIV